MSESFLSGFYIGYIIVGLLVGSFDTFIGYRKGLLQREFARNPGNLIFGMLIAFTIWPLTIFILIKKWDGKFK